MCQNVTKNSQRHPSAPSSVRDDREAVRTILPPALPVCVPHGEAEREAQREAQREAYSRLVLYGFQCVHKGVISVMSEVMKPLRESFHCGNSMGSLPVSSGSGKRSGGGL
jgi:hypothetical protein